MKAFVKHPLLADKALLLRLYNEEKLPITDIANRLECNHLMVHKAFTHHGIVKRSHSDTIKLALPKMQATCIEKYGAINPLSKGTIAERQRNDTVQQRYGVGNVFQREDIKIANIRSMSSGGIGNEKRLNTLEKRFGSRSPFGRRSVREKVKKSFLGGVHGRYISNLSRTAYVLLENNSIQYEPEFLITYEKKTYSYDLRVGDVLIELNGDHFHANPNRFNENDVVVFPGSKHTAKELWQKDAYKTNVGIKHGFHVVTLWEYDLKKNFEAVLLEAIRCRT